MVDVSSIGAALAESAEDLLASDPESLQDVIKAATTAIDKMRLNIILILVSGTNENCEGLDLGW